MKLQNGWTPDLAKEVARSIYLALFISIGEEMAQFLHLIYTALPA